MMKDPLQSLQTQVRVLNARIAELEKHSEEKDALIRHLQHQLSRVLRRQYGQKADRVDPNQLLLDICAQLRTRPAADSGAGGATHRDP
jgi:TolA-binding protein